MIIKEKVYWPYKSLKKKNFIFILKKSEKKKFIFPKKKKIFLKTYKFFKKYLLKKFKIKILSGLDFDTSKKKYQISLEKIYIIPKHRINYSNFINFFCIRFKIFKWNLHFYLKYLYIFFRHIFIFYLLEEHPKMFSLKFLYDLIYMLYFKNHSQKYLHNYWGHLSRFINYKKNYELSNISTFLKTYLPLFDLNTQITLCFIFRLRNLFLLVNYFNSLQLFETTGLDYHHSGRRRKSCQIKCLSNLLWHLIYRDKIKELIVFFFNLKHNSFDFLTYLTHVQYLKRFKGKSLNIIQLNIRFREQYGFVRGRKLAVRKRFLKRKRLAEQFFFFKEKKKYV